MLLWQGDWVRGLVCIQACSCLPFWSQWSRPLWAIRKNADLSHFHLSFTFQHITLEHPVLTFCPPNVFYQASLTIPTFSDIFIHYLVWCKSKRQQFNCQDDGNCCHLLFCRRQSKSTRLHWVIKWIFHTCLEKLLSFWNNHFFGAIKIIQETWWCVFCLNVWEWGVQPTSQYLHPKGCGSCFSQQCMK